MPGDELRDGSRKHVEAGQDPFETERRTLSDPAEKLIVPSQETKTPGQLADSFRQGLDALNSGRVDESSKTFKQFVGDVRQSLIEAYQHGGLKNLRKTLSTIDDAIEGRGNGIRLKENGLAMEFVVVRSIEPGIAQERVRAGEPAHRFIQDRGNWYESLGSFDLYPHGLRHDAAVLKKFEKAYGNMEEKAAEVAEKLKENLASHDGKGVSRWLMNELRHLTVDVQGHSSFQDALNRNLKGTGYQLNLDYKFGIKGWHGETGEQTIVEIKQEGRTEPVARELRVYDTVRSWGQGKESSHEQLGVIDDRPVTGTDEKPGPRSKPVELAEKTPRPIPAEPIEVGVPPKTAETGSVGVIEDGTAASRITDRAADSVAKAPTLEQVLESSPEARRYMENLLALQEYSSDTKLVLEVYKSMPELHPLAEATIRSIEYNQAIAEVERSTHLRENVKLAALAGLEAMRLNQIENPFMPVDLGKNIFLVEAAIKQRHHKLSADDVRFGRAEAMKHRVAVEKSVADYKTAAAAELVSSTALLTRLAAPGGEAETAGRGVPEDRSLLDRLKAAEHEPYQSRISGMERKPVSGVASSVPPLELVGEGAAETETRRGARGEMLAESSGSKMGRYANRTAMGVVGAAAVLAVVYQSLSSGDKKRLGEYVRSKISNK